MFNQRRKKEKEIKKEQALGTSLITFMDPQAIQSEEFRTLRTNIEFAQIDKKIKSLLVTSSIPMEGKSTTAANLGYVLAQTENKRVLIVDADLRKPSLHLTFRLNNERGLTTLLADDTIPFSEIIQTNSKMNLHFLPSGPIPPNPSELLASGKMTRLMGILAENFDFIIYDASPVNYVTDAKILATKTDGVLLIVRQNYTRKDDIRHAKQELDTVKANILGYVMNDVDNHRGDYGYGYYRYEEVVE